MENSKCKEKPIIFNTEMGRAILDGRKTQTRLVVKNEHFAEEFCDKCKSDKCKYSICLRTSPYKIGDILWVRETWSCGYVGGAWGYVYKASEQKPYYTEKWKSPVFMPKEACRIWLRVKDVRVERLQDISVENTEKEGIPFEEILPRIDFKHLWNSINKKPGTKWADNPFCWVIEFERIERNV